MGGEAAPLLAVRPALADDEVRALRERVRYVRPRGGGAAAIDRPTDRLKTR